MQTPLILWSRYSRLLAPALLLALTMALCAGCAAGTGGSGQPAPTPADAVVTADAALQAGRPEQAINLYTLAIKEEESRPARAAAHLGRGKAYLALGNGDQALFDFARAADLDESSAEARYLLASQLRAKDKADEAARALREAVTLRPDFAAAHNDLGLVLADSGQTREALGHFNAAVEASQGTLAEPYYNRATLRQELGFTELALADFTAALNISPNYGEALNNRGILHLTLGNGKDAVSDLTHAVALTPADPMLYFNRGIAYESVNDYESAIRDYTRSIGLAPGFAEAVHNRGVLYMRLSSRQAACTDFRRACELGLCQRLETSKRLGLCW